MTKIKHIAAATLLAASLMAARAELPADTLTEEVLPQPPKPHSVYVVDIVFAHMTEGKILVVDGDRRDVLGMVTTGFGAGVAASPDQKELYVTETFYSRGTRGDRTDVLTVFDASTLKPVAEVGLPPKRFISVTMPQGTVVTPDGRLLLQFNFTPATSVSVVDLKARKFVEEIATPGCSLIYPSASGRAFSMICGDGRLLTVTLDESGKAVEQRQSDRPFFDPDKDSVNVAPGRAGDRLFFVSFLGTVHTLDMSQDLPRTGETWSLLTVADRNQSWRPGGWQYVTVSEKLGRLYVVMHQGKDGSHKDPGSEIWVYDIETRKRLQRIRTKAPVMSLLASRDDAPVLYAMGVEGDLQVYDAKSGRYRGSMPGLAETALVLVNP